MNCPYCLLKVNLVDWGSHSQTCKHKKATLKRNRSPVIKTDLDGLDSFIVTAQGHKVEEEIDSLQDEVISSQDIDAHNAWLNDLNKKQLVEYLSEHEIEHDPKATVKVLRELAEVK